MRRRLCFNADIIDTGLYLLDENANVLDKNANSYPVGTIKAYGFKAGDGNYYAVDAEEPDRQFWGVP